jgi:sporulation protein YlmC with PRC-barrel domain
LDAEVRRSPPPKRYTHLMSPRTTARISLTALLGTPVTDAQGHLRGRLKDIAVATGEDAGKVAGLVLKTRAGLCIVPSHQVMETPAGTLELRSPARWFRSRIRATTSTCSRT